MKRIPDVEIMPRYSDADILANQKAQNFVSSL